MRGQILIPWLLVFGGCSFDSSGVGIAGSDARAAPADAAEARPSDAAVTQPSIDAAGFDARPTGAAACLSDEAYTVNGNTENSYKVNLGVLSWTDARAACEAEGAHLVVIEDDDENDFVKGMVENSVSVSSWIGLSDQASEGVYVWVDGQPLGTAQWAPGEPNNEADNEDCVFMIARGDTSGMWNDAPCMDIDNRLRSVCECDGGGVETK